MKRILSVFIVLLTFFLMTCQLFGPRQVKYEVTGTAALVDITIENEDGGTSQFSGVATPWSYNFSAPQDAFVYVSAQNQTDAGSVTTSIYVNAELFKVSTSSGAYVIATAYGSVP